MVEISERSCIYDGWNGMGWDGMDSGSDKASIQS